VFLISGVERWVDHWER